MTIINVSAYKFMPLPEQELPIWRETLKTYGRSQGLKGTILLSTEGINLFVAAPEADLNAFLDFLQTVHPFGELPVKFSPSEDQPFSRFLVKIKKEIISMGCDEVVPHEKTAPHLDAKDLEAWYKNNKDMLVLDTRNTYEVKLGTFENAKDLNIESFRDFPKALQQLEAYKDKPIVTFCTGGIRCEKAAELMLQKGFKEVYQLNGGILKYFEEVGADHYDGECFVFDKRVAVNADLEETTTIQCFDCRSPITPEEQIAFQGRCPYEDQHQGAAQG